MREHETNAKEVVRDCGTKIAWEDIESLDCSFKQYTNEHVIFSGDRWA